MFQMYPGALDAEIERRHELARQQCTPFTARR
jgi:hypothetical protein